MFHYYDIDAQVWRTIENPTSDEIAKILATVREPCSSCDADVEMTVTGPHTDPVVTITHEPGCPRAA